MLTCSPNSALAARWRARSDLHHVRLRVAVGNVGVQHLDEIAFVGGVGDAIHVVGIGELAGMVSRQLQSDGSSKRADRQDRESVVLGQDMYLEDFLPLVLQYRTQWFPDPCEVQTRDTREFRPESLRGRRRAFGALASHAVAS